MSFDPFSKVKQFFAPLWQSKDETGHDPKNHSTEQADGSGSHQPASQGQKPAQGTLTPAQKKIQEDAAIDAMRGYKEW